MSLAMEIPIRRMEHKAFTKFMGVVQLRLIALTNYLST